MQLRKAELNLSYALNNVRLFAKTEPLTLLNFSLCFSSQSHIRAKLCHILVGVFLC